MLVLISSGNDRDAGYHYRPLVAMVWLLILVLISCSRDIDLDT